MSVTDDDQFAAYGGGNYDYLAMGPSSFGFVTMASCKVVPTASALVTVSSASARTSRLTRGSPRSIPRSRCPERGCVAALAYLGARRPRCARCRPSWRGRPRRDRKDRCAGGGECRKGADLGG